jgi:hypothetical protein
VEFNAPKLSCEADQFWGVSGAFAIRFPNVGLGESDELLGTHSLEPQQFAR